jgi:hypothetical protein
MMSQYDELWVLANVLSTDHLPAIVLGIEVQFV